MIFMGGAPLAKVKQLQGASAGQQIWAVCFAISASAAPSAD
jgi:hypothetical protein